MRYALGPVAIVVALAAVASLVALGGAPSEAGAQTPGTISGVVRAGEGAQVSLDGVVVSLVQLGRGTRLVGETQTIEGSFRFEIPAVSANVTYVVSAVVDGVTYLGASPVVVSSELPNSTTEIVAWPATRERPPLRSQLTGLTLVFVDTRTGQVTLQREDLVLNPVAATWLGDADGVMLHLPVAAGASDIEGEAWYDGLPAGVTFSGGASDIAARGVLRPGVTLVTTRYTVQLDITAPEVAVELTAALPTDQMRILAPTRFARGLLPGARATTADPVTIEDERVFVVESVGAVDAGASIGGRVQGLGGRLEANPLSSTTSAVIGFGAVLVVVAVGAHLASQAGRRRDVARGAGAEAGERA